MKMFNNYSRTTPKKWRKLGDGLLAASATITTYAIATEHDLIAVVAMLMGTTGKFLTNFFAAED